MNVIDVDGLLEPITPEQPSGELLEYELFELSEATEDDPTQSKEPVWPEVKTKALALLSRSKDLSAAVALTKSLMHTDGFTGLADGLALIRGLLERYWESLYPALDSDNDPVERVTVLQPLCDYEGGGKDLSDMKGMVCHYLRRIPLVKSREIGEFSLKQVKIATGKWRFFTSSNEPQVEKTTIDAAFKSCDLDGLRTETAALQGALEDINAIDALLSKYIPNEKPSIDRLSQELQETYDLLEEQLGMHGVSVSDSQQTTAERNSPQATDNPPPGKETLLTAGEIRNRDDVMLTLDKLCEYYQRYEPSSPIPLLLHRAKRLVDKGFLEIMQDLAPDSIQHIELIGGVTYNESAE